MKLNTSVQQFKFFYKRSNPYYFLFYFFLLLFIWTGLFLIFLFNNSYSFIASSEIYNQTLLKTLSSALCGFGISVAGAAMQGITRNDLAGPTTLGLLPAATLGVVIFQLFNLQGPYIIFLLAILFCFLVILTNFVFLKLSANKTNDFKPILLGLILGAGISSINIIVSTTNINVTDQINNWIGSTTLGMSYDRLVICGPAIIVGCVLIFSCYKKLNIIEEDINKAISFGINVKLTYWIISIGTILITVSSVMLVGAIVIIGIVMPHLIRMIFKTRNYLHVITFSGLLTSMLIMFSVWINTRYSIGLNLFAVIVSTPIFIYLLFRRK